MLTIAVFSLKSPSQTPNQTQMYLWVLANMLLLVGQCRGHGPLLHEMPTALAWLALVEKTKKDANWHPFYR